MALADFIQALQEQEVVYSEPSKSSIRVIPPEHQQSLRVLPPETSNDVKVEPHVSTSNNTQASPQKIKLKIKLKPVDPTIQPASNFVSAPTATSTEKSPVPTTSASNIKHEEIPLTSQIILIVDSYFALTEERPYRNKLSTKDALEIIKQDAGKKWNQTLVNEFVTLIEHDMN